MIKPVELTRSLILACTLLLPAAAASAQSSADEPPAPTMGSSQRGIIVLQPLDTTASGGPVVQPEEQRAKLREQLADPKQRATLIKQRLQEQRAASPDLARVLRIDARTEAKLLALLVDQSLTDELREDPFSTNYAGSAVDGLQQAAEGYNQHIREVTKLLGSQRLDAYLDYERTRTERNRVETFAATLANPHRLTSQQRDALVDMLAEEEARQLRESRLGMGTGRVLGDDVTSLARHSPQELQRRNRMLRIYVNEQLIRQMAATDQRTLERLPDVLSPEQTQAYGALRARQLAELRARTDVLRQQAGVGPNELLAAEEPRALAANLDLQIDLEINGKRLRTTAATNGTAIVFAGPEGLSVEAEPTLLDSNTLSVELRFYEPAPGGQRLVGRSFIRPRIANAQTAPDTGSFNGFSGMKTVLRGRKAFLLDFEVTATLQ